MGLPLLAPSAALKALEVAMRAVGLPLAGRVNPAQSVNPALMSSGLHPQWLGSGSGSFVAAVMSVKWDTFLGRLPREVSDSPFYSAFAQRHLPPRSAVELPKGGGPRMVSAHAAADEGELDKEGSLRLEGGSPQTEATDGSAMRAMMALVGSSIRNIMGESSSMMKTLLL